MWWMAMMWCSITSTLTGTAQSRRSTAWLQTAAASHTRKATAEITEVSPGVAALGKPLLCAFTTMFMSPWQHSSTSRWLWRAAGRNPIISGTWPKTWALLVTNSINSLNSVNSMNSVSSEPRGLRFAVSASRLEVSAMVARAIRVRPGQKRQLESV